MVAQRWTQIELLMKQRTFARISYPSAYRVDMGLQSKMLIRIMSAAKIDLSV